MRRRGPTLAVGRLSTDFLVPIPQGRVEVTIDALRPGKRVELVEARMTALGRAVVARAWRIQTGPDSSPRVALGEGDMRSPGPVSVWARPLLPLVAGERSTGFERTRRCHRLHRRARGRARPRALALRPARADPHRDPGGARRVGVRRSADRHQWVRRRGRADDRWSRSRNFGAASQPLMVQPAPETTHRRASRCRGSPQMPRGQICTGVHCITKRGPLH